MLCVVTVAMVAAGTPTNLLQDDRHRKWGELVNRDLFTGYINL